MNNREYLPPNKPSLPIAIFLSNILPPLMLEKWDMEMQNFTWEQ